MSKIQIVVRWNLNEGALEAATAIAEEAVTLARANSANIAHYDWYLSGDQKTVTILESHASSETLLDHLGRVGPMLGRMGELGSMDIEVFGEPSEALAQAAAPMAPTVNSTVITL